MEVMNILLYKKIEKIKYNNFYYIYFFVNKIESINIK